MLKLRAPKRKSPIAEALEARVLYSGDPAPLVAQAIGEAWVQVAAPAAQLAPIAEQASVAQSAAARELVVIDSRVQDQASLIEDLQAQRDAGRAIEWVTISADQDGIAVISAALAHLGSVDSLHLVAHGQAGDLELGAVNLNLDSLRARAGELGQWANHFSDQADWLIYGCDLGAGERGSTLVSSLAALTGADIAASTDLTGSTLLGGNWLLEASTGTIESSLAFSAGEQAEWQYLLNVVPGGVETLVNSSTAGVQTTPAEVGGGQIVALPGGGSFVVWHDAADDAIHGRFLNAAGLPTGADLLISNSPGSPTDNPVVAFDAGGGRIVVAWEADGVDGSGAGVYSQVLDLLGNTVSAIQVNQYTVGDQDEPAIAVSPSGVVIFTWTDDTQFSTANIVGRAWNLNDPLQLSDEEIVNVSLGDIWDQGQSAVAFNSSGEFLITWESDGQDGSGSGIFARAFNNSFASVGGEFQVNTTNLALDQIDPTVIATADGNFVVAWTNTFDGDGIAAQRIDKTGNRSGGELQLNAVTTNSQNNPHLSAVAGGGFVATWQSDGNPDDADGYGIFARQFDGSGNPLGLEQLINSSTAGAQAAPSVSVSGNQGRVVWSGAGSGDTTGVFVRPFALVTPTLIATPVGSAFSDETGGTFGINYTLSTQPANTVNVTITTTDASEGVPLTTNLTFTPANWNVAQQVFVRGSDDSIVDGDVGYLIDAALTSIDTQYHGYSVATVAVNIDNDTKNILLVTTTSDLSDGNTSSFADLLANQGADGKISLREAILAANNTVNGSGGLDTIRFDPALGASITLLLGSALPMVTAPIHIDGITGTAYSSHPVVTLQRTGSATFSGLVLGAGSTGSTVEGLAIVGMNGNGLEVYSTNNVIEQNFIGVNNSGTAVNGNSEHGLYLNGAGNTIVRENILSGNGFDGLHIQSSNSVVVTNNLIGVNASATAVFGNGGDGVEVVDSANLIVTGNIIGGSGGSGLRLTGAATQLANVAGNSIGTNSAGLAVFANAGDGISIDQGASNNLIGGPLAGEGNRIQNSGGRGIHVWTSGAATANNALLGNLLDGNAYGIQLGSAANDLLTPLPNDPLDADGGANRLQNKPLLYTATAVSAVQMQVSGELRAQANQTYRIEFFADVTPHASGHGEAQVLLGYLVGTTDASGYLSISELLNHNLGGTASVTATATRLNTITFQNLDTSEFAENVPLASATTWVTPANLFTPENIAAAYLLTANNPDGAITYSIVGGADAGHFELRFGNQLWFRLAPNFEAPTSSSGTNFYAVDVQAVGPLGGANIRNFTIAVGNVFEAPLWNSSPSPALSEGQTFVHTLSATDPDGPGNPITYSVSGGADASQFAVNPTTGELSFSVPPNFEMPADAGANNVYDVTVRAIDPNGDISDQSVSVTVNNVNEAPVWQSSPTQSMAENSTDVSIVNASDPDAAATVSYSIVAGFDSALFTLDPVSHMLSFVAAPNFEAPADGNGDNSYDVWVRADDGSGGVTAQLISVFVTNVNEAPTIDQTGPFAVPENQPNVGVFSATDAESPLSQLSFSIVGGADAGSFTFNSVTRELSFVSTPDFENPSDVNADNTYEVMLAVSDSSGLTTSKMFNVQVAPANDAPTWITTPNQQVDEQTTAVATLEANDIESGSALSYSIIGGADAGLFNIDAPARALQLQQAPNFEAPADANADNAYEVIVRVTDPNGGYADLAMTVNVADLNESVVISGPAKLPTAEDTMLDFAAIKAAEISLLELDAGLSTVIVALAVDRGTLTLAYLGNAAFDRGDGLNDSSIRFSASLAEAELVLRNLQYTPEANYSGLSILNLTVFDEGDTSLFSSLDIEINVNPVNDAPQVERADGLSLQAGVAATLDQSRLLVSDVDDTDSNLRFTVLAKPSDIELRLNGQALTTGASFTQADVNAGRVTLWGTGVGNRNDQIILQVNDLSGATTADVTVPLNIEFGGVGGVGTAPAPGIGTGTGTGSGAGNSGSGASAAAAPKVDDTGAAPPKTVPPVVTGTSNGANAGPRNAATAAANPAGQAEGRSTIAAAQARDQRTAADYQTGDSVRLGRLDSSNRAGLTIASNRDQAGSYNLRRDDSQIARTVRTVLAQKSVSDDLDRVREQVTSKVRLEQNFAASSAAVSAGVSIGYVIWLLRGGVLVSSLLASIPAWSAIDPLPVLSSVGGRKNENGDDESLEEMLKKAKSQREADAAANVPLAEPGLS